MKNKRNKSFIYFLISGVIIVVGLVLVLTIINTKDTNELSLDEKIWIEENRNKIIDVSVVNNVPIFAMEGDGIFLSFLDFFEKETELELNKLSYIYPNISKLTDYVFRIVKESEELTKRDLLVYEDNYVIVSKENKKIVDINSLFGYKIGLMRENFAGISDYIKANNKLTYVPFDDVNNMLFEFSEDDVDYIIVPKNRYLDMIIDSDYYITYNLSALTDKYVLTLNGEEETLNSIFAKVYNKWYESNFETLYTKKMNEIYFSLSGIDERSKSAFKSKIYTYGYIENAPYETLRNNRFIGLNFEFLNGFEFFSGAQFKFVRYNSVNELESAINSGEVDVAFNYYEFKNLKDIDKTIEVYIGNYVLLSYIGNNVTIDSFASLKGKEIYTIKDTNLARYLNDNSNATLKAYNNINSLLRNKEPLILIDINMYNYYKNTKLSDYYIVYEDKADVNYNFIIKQDESNKVFSDVFQFYLMNINHTEFKNRGMYNLITTKDLSTLSYVIYVLLGVLFVIIIIITKQKRSLLKKTKEEKIKYIDPLTSLKNRTYLSVNMEKWDENEVYPQAIIIVDLNKLKDVNSNHGYEEGDKLIKAASNILINNQLENTDIIRSDGNEFLIYMVGYAEGQVVSYMRKLFKLMKNLPYEQGATLGYSMITDDVKLIEDAINEAVLDMITNKELKSNE